MDKKTNTNKIEVPKMLNFWHQIFQAIREKKPLPYNNIKLMTARFTGKTVTSVAMLLSLIFYFPEINFAIVCIRKDEKKLEDTIRDIESSCEVNYGHKLSLSRKFWKGKINQTEIVGYTLNPEKIRADDKGIAGVAQFYSARYVFVFADEVNQLDERLLHNSLSSFRAVNQEAEYLYIFFSNPWVSTNWFISDVMKQFPEYFSKNSSLPLLPPYFYQKVVGKTLYGVGSIWCNETLPGALYEKALDNSRTQSAKNIVLYGLPGVQTGLVYDGFDLIPPPIEVPKPMLLVAGIDIGETQTDGKGGATTCTIWKYDIDFGYEIVYEYYWHNVNGMKPKREQQGLIIEQLVFYQQKYKIPMMLYIDAGQTLEMASEWSSAIGMYNFDGMIDIQCYNFGADKKNAWPNYDRTRDINALLPTGYLNINPAIAPHLYSSLQTCMWKDREDVKEGVLPERQHQYTDILHSMEYALYSTIKNNMKNWGIMNVFK